MKSIRVIGFASLCALLGVALMVGPPFLCSWLIQPPSSGGQDWSGLIEIAVLIAGTILCGVGGLIAGIIKPGRAAIRSTLILAIASHLLAVLVCLLVWQATTFAAWHFISGLVTFVLGWTFWPQPWHRIEIIFWIVLPNLLILVIPTSEWDARRADVEITALLIRTFGIARVAFETLRRQSSYSSVAMILALAGQLGVIAFYSYQYEKPLEKAFPDIITLTVMLLASVWRLYDRLTRDHT